MTKRPSLANSMKALAEDTSPKPESLVASRTPALDKKVPPATRAGMKKLLTPVDPALHKRLKILAAKRSTTLEALIRAALDEYLAQHDNDSK